ncbi:uncharacterized protein PHACADRAFT_248931 [Phanerochaete carnosa HHB-10118-sp]|uniref:Uncharacterized protein n=1 Tax=Phanerochaete carnosa (strain HHB-10118-sp) TaxID=650164 RepID=K5V7W2_PHACS|nr:uncharacterized protein PHACADRAFT_248931 [Phanerochaete carnosa HHB-10118-sp]EKM58836.1 hypothetical protein PHACADRAFT_248931 [Phanerochaete carnosa HHB-10118-sp]
MSKTALFRRVPACGCLCRSCDGVFDVDVGTSPERRGTHLQSSCPPHRRMILSVHPMGIQDTQKAWYAPGAHSSHLSRHTTF